MFEWPLSERAPPGFKDANPATETMSLQVDDVFRMVEMTILLGILTPLSIRWMQQYWHLGIQVHRFVTVIYFVDIVRRHSHPHNWVLNTPIFAIWILDKVLCMAWRRIKAPNVIRHAISDDYMVLFWSTNDIDEAFNEVVSVGSNYYMKLYPSSWMESRHPFTAFKNRSAGAITMKSSEHCFSNGAVIRTFDNDRKPRIGGHVESRSHTERMSTYSPSVCSSLSIWGPFQGQVTNLISKALLDGKDSTSRKNLVLAGSGSAINFMIDLMSHLSSATSPLCYGVLGENVKNITLLYSTRDEALYRWVHETMKSLLGAIVMPAENKCTSNGAHIRILLACTANNKNKRKKNRKSEKKDFFPISSNNKKTEHMIEDFTLHNHNFVEEVALIPTSPSSTGSKSNSATASQRSDHDDIDEEQATGGAGSAVKNIEGDSIFAPPAGSSIDLLYQRLDYSREIPDGSDVFCQGSVAFKNVVKEGCNEKKNVRLFFDQ